MFIQVIHSYLLWTFLYVLRVYSMWVVSYPHYSTLPHITREQFLCEISLRRITVKNLGEESLRRISAKNLCE